MLFLPNAHPVFVHFTIGLFLSGAALNCAAAFSKNMSLKHAANWNIIGGATVTVITAVTGWFAAEDTPHGSGEIHALIERHELLGFLALAALVIAGGVQMWSTKSGRPAWAHWFALGTSMIGAALLLVAGAAGGKLVFVHGVGVDATPVTESHNHSGNDHRNYVGGQKIEPFDTDMPIAGEDEIDAMPHGASGESTAKPNHSNGSHRHGADDEQSHHQ